MFRDSPAVESAPDMVTVPNGLIPLSQLALDLPEPGEGWHVYLANRGIEIVADDLGRQSVTRADAKLLFAEHHDREAQMARDREAVERQAIEQDQQRRAQLSPGVPWFMIPAGVSPAQAMAQAGRDAEPRRVSPTQEWLDQIGQHAVQPADE